jgi:hypothetical protein
MAKKVDICRYSIFIKIIWMKNIENLFIFFSNVYSMNMRLSNHHNAYIINLIRMLKMPT